MISAEAFKAVGVFLGPITDTGGLVHRELPEDSEAGCNGGMMGIGRWMNDGDLIAYCMMRQ